MLGNRVMSETVAQESERSPDLGVGEPSAHQAGRQVGRDRPWSILAFAGVVLVLLIGTVSWVVIDSGGGSDATTVDAASLAAPGAASATSSPSPTIAAPPTSAASPADQRAAAQLVAAARQGASSYPTVASARAGGFRPAGALAVGDARLAVGYEIRLTDVDGRVDAARPNGLVYRRTAGGEEPVGALFLGVEGQHLSEPAGSLATWRVTSLRSGSGQPIEVLAVWFGPGVVQPFAPTWAQALGG
jgi:hypothetical protein